MIEELRKCSWREHFIISTNNLKNGENSVIIVLPVNHYLIHYCPECDYQTKNESVRNDIHNIIII